MFSIGFDCKEDISIRMSIQLHVMGLETGVEAVRLPSKQIIGFRFIIVVYAMIAFNVQAKSVKTFLTKGHFF